MKKPKLTAAFLCALLLAACAVKKLEPQYELPEAMLPHVKEGYAKICDKGSILYKMNCAKCHNKKVGRKELIPDFKPEQLKGYELRVINAQHESSMPDTLVTAEELGIIMVFLSYKKKNEPVKP